MTRDEAYDEIKRRGAVRAEVGFSGGGDEGYVEGITLLNADGESLAELSAGCDTGLRQGPNWDLEINPEASRDDRFIGLLQLPVWDRYGSSTATSTSTAM